MAETGWWMMQTVPTLDKVIPEAAICCLTASHQLGVGYLRTLWFMEIMIHQHCIHLDSYRSR